MAERSKLRIVKMTMSPQMVHEFREELRYDREGLKVNKLKDNGVFTEKRLFIDQYGARLFYAPTFKSVQQSSMAFRSIVEISLSKDAVPGLQRALEAGGPALHPITIKTAQNRYLAFLLADRVTRDRLAETLSFMVRRSRDGGDEDPRNVRIYDLWLDADRDGNGQLQLTEIMRVLRKMGVALSVSEIEKIFKKFDADESGYIDYAEFVDMYGFLTQLPVLQPIFDHLKDGSDKAASLLSSDELIKFFMELQGEEVSEQSVIKPLMVHYTRKEDPVGLSFSNFSTFLADGRTNSWIPPSQHGHDLVDTDRQLPDDMSRPFNDYFIATSHNTFLLGRQTDGDANADMIGIALQEHCRVVEFEVWDGPAGDPLVFRGSGLTIKARDAIRAVEENAFFRNPYPVFMICEMHCCDDQAAIFTHLLKAAFGHRLVNFNTETSKRTPAELQRHVIVCYKRTGDAPDVHKSIAGCSELVDEYARLTSQSRPSHRTVGRQELVGVTGMEMVEFNAAVQDMELISKYAPAETILQTSEKEVQQEDDFLRQVACGHLVRVVPDVVAHADSSNMNAMGYLAAGVSMVSMNHQTYDRNMRFAEAFFRKNLGCGYVLKPSWMRSDAAADDAAAARDEGEKATYVLTVTIIAGSQLPAPGNVTDADNEVIDPYVVVHIGGTPFDMENNPPLQTSIVEDNGFNPTWNHSVSFRITDLDFATVTLQVRTRGSPVHKDIAHASAAVSMIRLGYRAVPLYMTHDGSLDPNAVLVCHFELTKQSGPAAGAAAAAADAA